MPTAEAQSGVRSDALIPLRHYIEGYRTGDPVIMAKAFHPECKIYWMQDGEMQEYTGMGFAKQWTGRPMPNEERAVRRIASVHATGSVGIRVCVDTPSR